MLDLLGRGGPSEPETKRLCEVCAELTGTTGAGIMLMSGDIPRDSGGFDGRDRLCGQGDGAS
jgi:hypothetical protein